MEEGHGIPQTPQEEQQAETNYRVDNRLSSEINRNSTNSESSMSVTSESTMAGPIT